MVDFDTQRALRKNRIRRRGIYLLPYLFTTAALFAGFYAIVQGMDARFDLAAIAVFVAMVLDGLAMVSNLKYYSFKAINLRRSVPFLAIFAFVIVIAALAYQPATVLFAGFVAYAISGFVVSAWMVRKKRARRA
jgi:CDP-diacylglycerol--serine O-phosphatidyltransferase